MCVAMEDREQPIRAAKACNRSRRLVIKRMQSRPPSAVTIGNVAGRSQIASATSGAEGTVSLLYSGAAQPATRPDEQSFQAREPAWVARIRRGPEPT